MLLPGSRIPRQLVCARDSQRSLTSFSTCRCDLLGKGIGTVAHGVLPVRFHLAEADVVAFGFKDRIIAKTVGAARRPDDEAIDTTLECLDMPIGPSEGEGADEMGVMPRFGAFGRDRKSTRLNSSH